MCYFCDKIYNNEKLHEIDFTGRRDLKITNAIVKEDTGKIGLWHECDDSFYSGIILYLNHCPKCGSDLENREITVSDKEIDELLSLKKIWEKPDLESYLVDQKTIDYFTYARKWTALMESEIDNRDFGESVYDVLVKCAGKTMNEAKFDGMPMHVFKDICAIVESFWEYADDFSKWKQNIV